MSILIIGMEMTKNCVECPLAKNYGMCAIIKKQFNWGNPDRLSDCPLIELPAPHGDLIDRDAINYEDEIWKKKCIPPQVVYNAWVVCGEMPTIIGAED